GTGKSDRPCLVPHASFCLSPSSFYPRHTQSSGLRPAPDKEKCRGLRPLHPPARSIV
ncbi:MAG: hypothetical protein AVDCRST_MAG88-3004, partial [uncultured Thermomicrobiales bacterium]